MAVGAGVVMWMASASIPFTSRSIMASRASSASSNHATTLCVFSMQGAYPQRITAKRSQNRGEGQLDGGTPIVVVVVVAGFGGRTAESALATAAASEIPLPLP